MSTEAKKTTAVAKKKTDDITEIVMHKVSAFVDSGELVLPTNYSPDNAIRGAKLILTDMKVKGTPVLEHCTKASIANALFKMVTLGLSVVKKQGSFIPYGTQLNFQEEYTGNIVLAKRYGKLAENPKTHVIYEGDDFEFEIDTDSGITKILKHKPSLESLGNRKKIKGAYCIYKTNDGKVDVEIMNMEQIELSWKQGAANGGSGAHNNFSDQMAKKTVINRAMKLLIRGSDDAALFSEGNDEKDLVKESVSNEIDENANQDIIDIDHVEENEPETHENVDKETGEVKETDTVQKPLF